MNEQIKKLVEQAGGFVDINKHVGGNNGCVVYTYDGLQAFAELIVKECVKVCSIRAGNSDYNTGRMHCASDIAEYFDMRTPGKYEPKMPEFNNVRDCIRYMKNTPDDFYPGTIWTAFAFSGSKWTDAAQRLRNQLLTGKARGEVFLTDQMAFLLNYMK